MVSRASVGLPNSQGSHTRKGERSAAPPAAAGYLRDHVRGQQERGDRGDGKAGPVPSQARGQGRGQGSPWQKSEAKDPNQGPPPKTAARAFPESAHVFRGPTYP